MTVNFTDTAQELSPADELYTTVETIEDAVLVTGKDASTIRWYLREDAKPDKVVRNRLRWIGEKLDPADPSSAWARIRVPNSFVLTPPGAECAGSARAAAESAGLQVEIQQLREENARLQGRLDAQESRVQFLEQLASNEQSIRMAIAQAGLALPAPGSAQELPAQPEDPPTPAHAAAGGDSCPPCEVPAQPAVKFPWWKLRRKGR